MKTNEWYAGVKTDVLKIKTIQKSEKNKNILFWKQQKFERKKKLLKNKNRGKKRRKKVMSELKSMILS